MLLTQGGFQPKGATYRQDVLTVTVLAGLLSSAAFSYFEIKARKEGKILVGPGFAQVNF